MGDVCLGAYATLQEATEIMALRFEPSAELAIWEDGDSEHPWRIWWTRLN
jgi:hypothetical protein